MTSLPVDLQAQWATPPSAVRALTYPSCPQTAPAWPQTKSHRGCRVCRLHPIPPQGSEAFPENKPGLFTTLLEARPALHSGGRHLPLVSGRGLTHHRPRGSTGFPGILLQRKGEKQEEGRREEGGGPEGLIFRQRTATGVKPAVHPDLHMNTHSNMSHTGTQSPTYMLLNADACLHQRTGAHERMHVYVHYVSTTPWTQHARVCTHAQTRAHVRACTRAQRAQRERASTHTNMHNMQLHAQAHKHANNTHVHAHMHNMRTTRTCMHIRTNAYNTHVHTHVQTHTTHVHTCAQTRTQHAHAYTCAQTHMHAQAHKHAHNTHVHTHTHKHALHTRAQCPHNTHVHANAHKRVH